MTPKQIERLLEKALNHLGKEQQHRNSRYEVLNSNDLSDATLKAEARKLTNRMQKERDGLHGIIKILHTFLEAENPNYVIEPKYFGIRDLFKLNANN